MRKGVLNCSRGDLDKTQKEIIDYFQSLPVKRMLVSAPTSYGKTFIMREILYLSSYIQWYDSGVNNFNADAVTGRVVSGDFNGDGKTDVAAIYDCGNYEIKIYVWLSNGTSYNSPQVWYDSGPNSFDVTRVKGIAAGDFNGDGKDDIAVMYGYDNARTVLFTFMSTGSAFQGYNNWYDSGINSFDANRVNGRMVSGDFNHDGKDDIAVMYGYDNYRVVLFTFMSTGSAFQGYNNWYDSGINSFDVNRVSGRIVAGDFNGDGKDDIAVMYGYDNAQTVLFTFMSTGSAFQGYNSWYNSGINSFDANATTGRVVAGDFNGDGKTDIAALYSYSNNQTKAWVFLSNGSSFSSYIQWYDSGVNNFNADAVTGRVVSGDFNGDGKADISTIYYYDPNTTRLFDFISSGSSFSSNQPWYYTGNDTNTNTTQLASITNGSNAAIGYTYDANGNISTISEGGVLKVTYTYDELNELKREDNVYQSKTITYTYDVGGNLTARTQYAYTNPSTTPANPTNTDNYAYGNSNWTDELTSYDNHTFSYDAIGNPLTYYNGSSYTFTWQNGRELATADKTGTSVSYQYDDSGIRTSKTVNGVTTNYYLNGSSIVTQITGNDRLDYFYDENGSLFGFNYNGANYYYVRNGQNDIIGILDSTGTQVVSYQYDTWGKLLGISGSQASGVGTLNPFRYRGYYYDTETGLYYLNSRYYDPATCRMLNADDTSILRATQGDLLGTNLFAYCGNNPVMRSDENGDFWQLALAADGGYAAAMGVETDALAVGVGDSWNPSGWVIVGVAVVALGVTVGIYYSKGGKQNIKDSGLTGMTDQQIKDKLKDPHTSKAEKQRLQKEQKARGSRNKQKRSN